MQEHADMGKRTVDVRPSSGREDVVRLADSVHGIQSADAVISEDQLEGISDEQLSGMSVKEITRLINEYFVHHKKDFGLSKNHDVKMVPLPPKRLEEALRNAKRREKVVKVARDKAFVKELTSAKAPSIESDVFAPPKEQPTKGFFARLFGRD